MESLTNSAKKLLNDTICYCKEKPFLSLPVDLKEIYLRQVATNCKIENANILISEIISYLATSSSSQTNSSSYEQYEKIGTLFIDELIVV